MKTIWTVLCVMAIANVLAIGGFTLWLKGTDRLDGSRLQRVRQVFAETRTQQSDREAKEQAAAEADAKSAEAAQLADRPPLTAMDQLTMKLDMTEADRQRLERLKREVEDLKSGIAAERAQLDRDRAEFLAMRDAFEQEREVIRQLEGTKQFKKTLATLEGLKPSEAKIMLAQLISDDATGSGKTQAVSYLNSLDDDYRAKVLGEFLKADPKLATDLLERLRTRGVEARAG